MKKIVIICILFLTCLGFSSFAFSAVGDVPISCNTLSHIYKWSKKEMFSKQEPRDLSSFSVDERVKIYNKYFIDNEVTQYECDDELFDFYSAVENYLRIFAEENKNKDDIKKEISLSLDLPSDCLDYRETYMQHMQPKLENNKAGAQWSNVYINDFVTLIDISMMKMKYNQPEKILNEYCHYANQVWQHDPDMVIKDYHASKKKYPLTKYCEKVFSEFEDMTFNDFYPEKDKRLDGMVAMIVRGKQIADPTASGLMEKRAWLSLLYKNYEDKMDDACRYDHLNH